MSTWVHSQVFGGIRVTHLFSFLFCIFVLLVLCLMYPMCLWIVHSAVFSFVYLKLLGIVTLLHLLSIRTSCFSFLSMFRVLYIYIYLMTYGIPCRVDTTITSV